MRGDNTSAARVSAVLSWYARPPPIGLRNRSRVCAEELYVEAEALIEVWHRLVKMINQVELGVCTGRSVVEVALAGDRR